MDEQKTPKKSNVVLIIVIVLAVFIILGIGGYFTSRYFAKRAAEALITAGTGGVVSTKNGTTTIKTGDTTSTISEGSQKWPSDLPAGAPEFKYGKVKMVSSSPAQKIWSITLDNVNKDANSKYESDLVKAGWTKDADVQFMVDLITYKKSGYTLTAAFDPSSNGEVITVSGDVN